MSFSQILTALGAAVGIYGILKVIKVILEELNSPIRHFPGLTSKNWILGNLREIWYSDQSATHEKWVEAYGPTFKFKSMFRRNRIYTVDPKAINHILKDAFTYHKPGPMTNNLKPTLGEGLLLTEAEVHRKQRRVLNPAFGPLQIKELVEIFNEKAIQLRDIWSTQVHWNNGEAKIDALSWLSKAALDVIGEAGFGYDFGALVKQPDQKNELHDAFAVMFQAGTKPDIVQLLRGMSPMLRFLPARREAEYTRAKETMLQIGRKLISDCKSLAASGKPYHRKNDLLSLLVHANISTDILDHQRLSDDHVLAQIPTFIFAGHETTATAITWALYSLSNNKMAQSRLRAELSAVSTDNPTMDELNALPYLEAVVRETLRLHAPVASTIRVAIQDDVLPLQTPVVDELGKTHHEVKIGKGQMIMMSIATINRLKSIWGDDAHSFNPDRWTSVPQAAMNIPGVWGNMLTFLGGPHACIGYRFALAEIKALLFAIIRTFEFELAVPVEDIIKRTEIVSRPVLRTDPDNANQLPLLVRFVS